MEIKLEDLKKEKILGRGTYGECYLVQHQHLQDFWVLKQIQILGMNETQQQEVIKQARILEALNHPCIVKFLASFKEKNHLNIVMEYADGGDLNQKINQAKKAKEKYFSQEIVLDWFTQICLALKHVHDRKVVHRDLKSQNIFLTKEGFVKLGDFGISKPLMMTLDKMSTVVGTPYYMSPEICENHSYSFKTDIWSLGVILYEMCALRPPFDSSTLPSLAVKITKGQYNPVPSIFSKELKRLIGQLLQVKPEKRPEIKDILKKPFLEKRIYKYLNSQTRARQFSHTILHSKNIFQKQKQNNRQVFQQNMHKIQKIQKSQKVDSKKMMKGEVISPRNNHKNIVKTPQNKNIDFSNRFKEFSGKESKDSKVVDKKKKIQAFKRRQISEPNLAPGKFNKNDEKNKQMKQNNSMVNLEKKKSDKQKKEISFKKNKQAFILEIEEIKECRSQVLELKEQYSQRACSNNLIVEEQIEDDEVSLPVPKEFKVSLRQQKMREAQTMETIEETLESVIYKNFKGKQCNMIDNPICQNSQGSGLLTLMWGLKQFA